VPTYYSSMSPLIQIRYQLNHRTKKTCMKKDMILIAVFSMASAPSLIISYASPGYISAQYFINIQSEKIISLGFFICSAKLYWSGQEHISLSKTNSNNPLDYLPVEANRDPQPNLALATKKSGPGLRRCLGISGRSEVSDKSPFISPGDVRVTQS
jgi:hypothetical protein